MSPEFKSVFDFCLEHAPAAPLQKRVSLYRGLAEFCGNAKQAAEFRSLAAQLEEADRRCREFAFQVQNPKPIGGVEPS